MTTTLPDAPALERYETRPLFEGQFVLQFNKRPGIAKALKSAEGDDDAIAQAHRDANNNLITETVIVSPRQDSPVLALVIEKGTGFCEVSVVPREAKTLQNIPAFVTQNFRTKARTAITGTTNEYTPIDTKSWLKEGRDDGRFPLVHSGHYCEEIFRYDEQPELPYDKAKGKLDTALAGIKKVGLVGGWSGIDGQIIDLIKGAAEGKTTPTMLEMLDAKLAAKHKPLMHVPSARKGGRAIVAEED